MTAEINCHCCPKSFGTYSKLADHILSEKTGHKKSRRWALKYKSRRLLQTQIKFSHNGDDPDKIKTDYGNEQRENARRRLSGEQIYRNFTCPKCQKIHRPLVEVEYANSPFAWKIGNRLAKLCMSCER